MTEVPTTPTAPDGNGVLRRFGAFEGVFTPTLLTILGVIMYLREGWVVGQVGLAGAWVIIALASTITACTALSLSSIATNVQMEEGGPYAIISRSLGLELGGSVGIPQFLSQALAVTMYIFGFREGWLWLFPDHPALLVDVVVFACILGIALVSASVAFRTQYVVMAVIAASLVSALGSFDASNAGQIEWWRGTNQVFTDTQFWLVFAVFFPATTGILAGANMSGELKNPRRSIPVGTLAAVGVGTTVYFALAFWFAAMAPPEELRSNFNVMIERSLWAPAVIAGLLGATFSSALSAIVGAPRILAALASSQVIPRSSWLAARSGGEPRRALAATGAVVLAAIMLRDLNVIAPLITLFFLITYGMINVVVLLEQRLAVVSFRPRLRFPLFVPLLGTVGCVFAMFVINATFSLVAISVVIGTYALLMRRKLRSPAEDVRSGLFLMVAEWAARHAARLSQGRARAWKVNLLVPVVDPVAVLGVFSLISDLSQLRGSITLIGMARPGQEGSMHDHVERLADQFTEVGAYATASVLEVERVERALGHAMQTLRRGFLRPNLLFLTLLRDELPREELASIIRRARDNEMGVILAVPHPRAGLGRRKSIRVWVRSQAPDWDLQTALQRANLDLAVLVPYLLDRVWDGELEFLCACDEGEEDAAESYLGRLLELSRMPGDARARAVVGDLDDCIRAQPRVDLNVFGLREEDPLGFAEQMIALCDTACLFVHDGGTEDATA